jgi:hypothetical protein
MGSEHHPFGGGVRDEEDDLAILASTIFRAIRLSVA